MRSPTNIHIGKIAGWLVEGQSCTLVLHDGDEGAAQGSGEAERGNDFAAGCRVDGVQILVEIAAQLMVGHDVQDRRRNRPINDWRAGDSNLRKKVLTITATAGRQGGGGYSDLGRGDSVKPVLPTHGPFA